MGKIIWLTGNSGSGKTTLANILQSRIPDSVVLDGDEMRLSISYGTGFGMVDRMEHNIRVARLATVLRKRGHIVIVSVIAPTNQIRSVVSKLCNPMWVHVDKSQWERDDYPYEVPEHPDLRIDNDQVYPSQGADIIMEKMGHGSGENQTSRS